MSEPPPTSSRPLVRGRPFLKGNPGRKPGSQNRITRLASQLLQENSEALIAKAVEKALNGDGPMLQFLLTRLLPRERTIKIPIPNLASADDTVMATATITRAATGGDISPSEGAALTQIVKANRDAIDLTEVVRKIDELRQKVE